MVGDLETPSPAIKKKGSVAVFFKRLRGVVQNTGQLELIPRIAHSLLSDKDFKTYIIQQNQYILSQATRTRICTRAERRRVYTLTDPPTGGSIDDHEVVKSSE